MRIKCDKYEETGSFALVGAGYTATEIIESLGPHIERLTLVVDSNSVLHGKKFASTNIFVSDFNNLYNFEGEILIACSGGLFLQQSLITYSNSVLNYFYNYDVNRAFYLPMMQNKSGLNDIFSCFKDKQSKVALTALIEAIEFRRYGKAMNATSSIPFFGLGNFTISHGERILDLGSYKGNHFSFLTLRDLQKIDQVICIEPNQGNNDDLRNIFKEDSEKHRLWLEKMTIFNGAISDTPGFATNSQNAISNRIDYIKDPKLINLDSIKVFALDDFIDFEPTLITVDIEGEELRMLQGGRNLIKKHKPKIAISSYHEARHLFDFIAFFTSLGLFPSFSFRLHDFGFMDQVLYVDFQN